MWPRRRSRPFSGRAAAVDTHDVHAFPGAARRTRVLQLAFAGAALTLVVAAAASARDLETRERGLLPSGTTGVAVVDLSLSIADEEYRAVRRAFQRLIEEDASIGLVVFSDVSYELLPPGTPASQLRPMLRLLVPPALGPPVNPWTATFRAGTRISTALALARDMLERDRVKSGSILLVSDLETAPDDVPALTRMVQSLRESSIELRVVALAPSTDARLIFQGLVDEGGAFEAPSSTLEEPAASDEATSRLPRTLLILGALVFIALAAHERFAGRLALTGRTGGTHDPA
jgi:VWA domain-containing protein